MSKITETVTTLTARHKSELSGLEKKHERERKELDTKYDGKLEDDPLHAKYWSELRDLDVEHWSEHENLWEKQKSESLYRKSQKSARRKL